MNNAVVTLPPLAWCSPLDERQWYTITCAWSDYWLPARAGSSTKIRCECTFSDRILILAHCARDWSLLILVLFAV